MRKTQRRLDWRRFIFVVAVLMLGSVLLMVAGCGRGAPNNVNPQVTEPPAEESDSGDNTPEAPSDQDATDESDEDYGAKGALSDTDLTLEKMLSYAVQDEYLAHDEYAAIIDEFGNVNPYPNIMRSEEMHLSLLKGLYDAYGITFPADEAADHVVVPPTLLAAAQTGVQAEIDNIAMYNLFLSQDLPDDVRSVFTRLRDASESHLAAFRNQVDRLS